MGTARIQHTRSSALTRAAVITNAIIATVAASCAWPAATAFAQVAPQSTPPEPGTVFQDCETCPEMVVIPPGSFMMGSEKNPVIRDLAIMELERPVHVVTIKYSYAVGRYPVTFDEWDACVDDGGCDGYRPDHIGWRGHEEPGWGRGTRPVFRVNYVDIQPYLKWLNTKTGGGYRLLSEAEWEYMARAGTTTEYNTGDTITQKQAKFLDPETSYARKEGNWKIKMVPVGSFPPNAFGIYDTHGGIIERVQDCWHPNYDGAPTDGTAWIDGGDCDRRSTRGGGWNSKIRGLRIARRYGYPIQQRSVSYGFRVAKSLSTQDPNQPIK